MKLACFTVATGLELVDVATATVWFEKKEFRTPALVVFIDGGMFAPVYMNFFSGRPLFCRGTGHEHGRCRLKQQEGNFAAKQVS